MVLANFVNKNTVSNEIVILENKQLRHPALPLDIRKKQKDQSNSFISDQH